MQQQSYQKLRQDFERVQEGLRKLWKVGHFDQSNQILNMISLKSYDFDLQTVRALPTEDVMIFLLEHRQLNPFQLSILAGLLQLEGEMFYLRKSFADSLVSLERSLKILLFLDGVPENAQEMPDLSHRLQIGLGLHKQVRAALSES